MPAIPLNFKKVYKERIGLRKRLHVLHLKLVLCVKI